MGSKAASWFILLAFLGVAGMLSEARADQGPKPSISGTAVTPERWVRSLVGRAPLSLKGRVGWARLAARRIEADYRQRGFEYCRVAFNIDSEGRVSFDVDEGYMARVELIGSTDIVKHVMFPLDFSLPEGIFQRRLVNEALGRFRVRHGLGPVTFRVRQGRLVEGPFETKRRERYLQIQVNRPSAIEGDEDEDTVGPGLGFKLTTDLRWGANAVGTLGLRNLIGKGDALNGRLEIGIPLRDMLVEEEGRLRWVYGKLQLRYNMPTLGDSGVMPLISSSTSLFFDGRSDLGLKRALTLRTHADLGVVWRAHPLFAIGLVGRLSFLKHMRVEVVEDWPESESVAQTDGSLWGELIVPITVAERDFSRRDLRSRLFVTPKLAITEQRLSASVHAIGQYTLRAGDEASPHYIIFRTQAWGLFGDVVFWDERPLSGTVHRVYMQPYIWARHAAQLELAWRFPVIGEDFMLGLFHDFSVFGDRSKVPDRPTVLSYANAFGPSAHGLIFNFLAVDLFYGFGFSHTGAFTHTLTFTVRNVF